MNRIRGWAKILGVLSATGGAVVMILDSAEHSSIPLKQAIFGELLLLMNCVCMAAYVTIQKQFLFKQEGTKVISIYPPVSLTAWIYGFTAISMAVSVIYYVVSDRSVFDLDTSILIPCFYAVFISSGLCFVLITWANKQTSPTIVTAFWPVQVPVTVVLSAMIFQSQLNWHHYLGAFLIISGLLLVCWAKHNLEKEQEEIKYTKLQEEIN